MRILKKQYLSRRDCDGRIAGSSRERRQLVGLHCGKREREDGGDGVADSRYTDLLAGGNTRAFPGVDRDVALQGLFPGLARVGASNKEVQECRANCVKSVEES